MMLTGQSCSHVLVSLFCYDVDGAKLFKKGQGFIISKQISMKFGRIVLQVNTHQLTKLDF